MSDAATRVAIVTGSGRGIGQGVATRLAADGFHVVVVDINDDLIAETVALIENSGGSAEGAHLDVTDRAAVLAAFAGIAESRGRIDAVVNCAMRVIYHPLEEFTEDDVDSTFAIGFKSLLWTTQAAIPAMIAQGGGSIVTFSSPAATRGITGSSIYSAVKGAVSSITWQLAGELGPHNIRVNGIIPGAVPTPGAREVVDEAGYELRKKGSALGRLATPDDIAYGVSYLLSPGAAYVNGTLLSVTGHLL